MSFFNLTMVGYQEPIKHYQVAYAQNNLPPINCPRIHVRHFSKAFDSNLKYHEVRHKHIRDPRGPHDMYTKPLTTSQQIGWFTKEEPLKQNLKWAVVDRRVFPKSEMTSFAHQMCLKDPSFRMY